MTGRYLLDTNAVVSLLQGNPSLEEMLSDASWIGMSVITELEFLAFPDLSSADERIFNAFKKKIAILSLDSNDQHLIRSIIELRCSKTLKLPDAIIAAKAIGQNATLITADTDFIKVPNLRVNAL